MILKIKSERVCATKYASRDPFRVLECRHGLAEILERGGGVVAELLVGWSIVLRGIYMGSLILGATRQDALGYTFIGLAINALRLSISGDAETIGVSKKGQVFFVALPLLVAAASFATLEPSELLSP